MRNFHDLTPGELSTKLKDLTHSAPSSGLLRPLAFALDAYTGRGSEQLDQQIEAFDSGRKAYEYRVQRGYGGVMEWRRITEAAAYVATALDVIQGFEKKQEQNA